MSSRKVYLARHGVPQWEPWWVESNGYERSKLPDENDLVGFANFDLQQNGMPIIQRSESGDLEIEYERGTSSLILSIIRRHGFEFTRE